MRILALGDVHGCFRALQVLEQAIPIRPDDQLITLGDYVDRGPQSRQVLDWLIDRKKRGPLIALQGNHEMMMIGAYQNLTSEFRQNWLEVGGRQTLKSYTKSLAFEKRPTFDDVPQEHWDFLKNDLVLWHETESHIFVHASVQYDLPMDEQPDYKLLWEGLDENEPPHQSGKIVIAGHLAIKDGRPWNLEHAICIDTWVYGAGWLTCLDVRSGQYWQANQLGAFRSGWIDDL